MTHLYILFQSLKEVQPISELSHEAAVGKIAEEEVLYLMSRGLTEEEAASMIVKGFLSMDIAGLPPELAAETKRMIDLSIQGM